MAAVVQIAAPAISELIFSEMPRIYRSAVTWLTPPYLYLVLNGIILSIAATSRFQKMGIDEEIPPAPMAAPAVEFQIGDDRVEESDRDRRSKEEEVVGDADEEDFVISRSDWTPKSRRGTLETESFAVEKPLVSERFGSRKSGKAVPEGLIY